VVFETVPTFGLILYCTRLGLDNNKKVIIIKIQILVRDDPLEIAGLFFYSCIFKSVIEDFIIISINIFLSILRIAKRLKNAQIFKTINNFVCSRSCKTCPFYNFCNTYNSSNIF
ncbi:MAG: hypothetical protein AAB569_00950, partial [Patescibacteria group bacterium]